MADNEEIAKSSEEHRHHHSGGGDVSSAEHHHHHHRHHHSDSSDGSGEHHHHSSEDGGRRHHSGESSGSGEHHHHHHHSSGGAHGHSSFGKHRNAWRTGKQNVVTFAILLAVLFVIAAAFAIVAYNRSVAESLRTVAFDEEEGGDDADAKAKALKKKRDEGLGSRFIQVTKVQDGQTIEVVHNESSRQVRVRGIECLDTSNGRRAERQAEELNLDSAKVKWYGEAASSYVLAFVTSGSQIAIRLPVDGPEPVDDTGALLAYVEAGNRDLGAELIRRGLAKASTGKHPRLAEYRKLESEARRNKVGMFGAL